MKPIQQSLDPRKIRSDLNTQSREKTCDETVREYAEAMENGKRFPPIIVFFDLENDQYILADGFHRLFAHLRARPNDPIIAEQYLGNAEDAQWYSIGANKSHGLKRSNADKRNAVTLALLHPKGVTTSNRKIAGHVGVVQMTVLRIRKALVSEGRLAQSASRVGADGRTYNISNIGKNQTCETICGGCGHYESPRCIIEGVIHAPNDPACEEFVLKGEEEPDMVADMEPEFGAPGHEDEYIPKKVRHRAARRKRGEYIEVPLSKTNTDYAAATIRHYFDDNYLAALAQSALKLLKESQ